MNIFKEADESLFKTILDVSSPIIVILLFIFERVQNRKTRNRDLKIEWYYKMMIEPNAAKIDDFFAKTIKLYEDAFNSLSATPSNSINSQKGLENSRFRSLKKDFEISIIRIFFIRYFTVATKLTDILLEIEDLYSGSIDNIDAVSSFSEQLFSKKSVFYEALYEPIK